MDHFVITVARETGSGGHDITRKLSEKLNIPYYDRDLLRKASEVSGIHERLFGAADERIGWKEMLSAAEKVYTGEILPPDSNDFISTRNLFSFQAKIIKELAATEDCIILGRCANYLLMDQPNVRLLRLFVHAPLEARLARGVLFSGLERPRGGKVCPHRGQAPRRLLPLLYRRGMAGRRRVRPVAGLRAAGRGRLRGAYSEAPAAVYLNSGRKRPAVNVCNCQGA